MTDEIEATGAWWEPDERSHNRRSPIDLPAMSVRRGGIQWPIGITVAISARYRRGDARWEVELIAEKSWLLDGKRDHSSDAIVVARFWRKSKAIELTNLIRKCLAAAASATS